MDFGLLLRTVVHLRPLQVCHQIRHRISVNRYAKYVAPAQGISLHGWIAEPIARPHSLDGESFEFLNIRKSFPGWCDVSDGMLWAYNLNYFDYLNQSEILECEGVRWIDAFIDTIHANHVGLDPYPTALRLENWIKFFCRFPSAATSRRVDSLYSQYRLLQRSLEKHLLGNHLLEDYISLYITSQFFSDLDYHHKVYVWLIKELSEEILSDGGHFEQSPMYHCILLDRLLDCINVKMTFEKADPELFSLKKYASRMLGYLEAICFSDYSYPLFNDSAIGIAPVPMDILDYARRLGLQWDVAVLGASGYRKIAAGELEAVVDVGEITASYQPGHTHADVLNYELRIGGMPFVVDTGISTYNKTPRRQIERSTTAHNCITVRGRNCAEVWGGFRVAGRYQCQLSEDNQKRVSAEVKCCGSERYSRTFTLSDGVFSVEDILADGFSNVGGISRIHLAPEVNVGGILRSGTVTKVLTSAGRITIVGADDVRAVPCEVSRKYNRLLPAVCIEMTLSKHLKYSIER